MKTTEATPRPWYKNRLMNTIDIHTDGHTEIICTVYSGYDDTDPDSARGEANAELIVRAVNHFDELVEIAEFVRDHSSGLIKHKCEVLLTKVKK